MIYRKDKYGNDVSLLGFGCMRFTAKDGKIDLDKAEKEILAAIEGGVNYFDTAYVYPGSEAALGEILARNHVRERVKIATKLPHYLLRDSSGMEKYFQEELRRLQTDHVDYYLMHMLTDVATWERLKGLGIQEWLKEKKRSGAIGQVGFSYHGNTDTFERLVDAYDWDFCQIQYNYLDEHTQAGRKGLVYAHEKGLPVIIMEPLRGGRLVNRLPQEALDIFQKYPIQDSPAGWAFRWLYNQPEVTCVLSGMNSLEMVEENVKTASGTRPGDLGEEEEKMLAEVARAINGKQKVGCTGCRYCMPCPAGVDIPGSFAAYNRYYSDGKLVALKEYMMCTALRQTPAAASQCVACGKCERHCPQGIEIRKELRNVSKRLESPAYKLVRWAIKRFRAY